MFIFAAEKDESLNEIEIIAAFPPILFDYAIAKEVFVSKGFHTRRNDVMKIRKIKDRGVLFTHSNPGWDLNVYLIMGRKCNYIIDTGLGSLSIDPIKDYIKNDNKKTIVINTHYHWDHVWGNGS